MSGMKEVTERLEGSLEQLRGEECWYVMAGDVGSILNLHFGERVPRLRPLKSGVHTKAFRSFRGLFILVT